VWSSPGTASAGTSTGRHNTAPMSSFHASQRSPLSGGRR
jgi:hypothetical protein